MPRANRNEVRQAQNRAKRELAKIEGIGTVAYSPEITSVIVARIAAGQALETICSEPGMPNWVTVNRWLMKYPEFEEAYEKARPLRARARAERAERETEQLLSENNRDMVYAHDIRIRNLHKLAALGDPARYSDKVQHVHTGQVAVDLRLDLGTSAPVIDHEAEDV